MTTVAYTDGACMGNPGPGGWAWAVEGGAYASGSEPKSTNQRMEIRAALEAVRAFPQGPLEIVSDSTYVVHCFRDRWWEGWKKRGWLNTAKKPVANRDLWEPLIEAVQAEPGRVRFRWVKGHSGDAMNDLVDRLAVEASQRGVGRGGTGRPEGLGEADTPRRRIAKAAEPVDADGYGRAVPSGHLLAVLGHRPPELGGYGDNPVADAVRRKLIEIVAAKLVLHPDLKVVSGLGLGAEQAGAEAAIAAGVPFVAVFPFPDPDKRWPEDSRRRFKELVDAADGKVLLQGRPPASTALAGAALRRRDDWLADNIHEAVVVWDGVDPNLGRMVKTLEERLGEDDVWVVDPADVAS
ncbi:MAG TPA: RNase H family protein [Acidimicrobiales bacterium]|nr:RNase H family protein [Acidimicrobiales bacterium]